MRGGSQGRGWAGQLPASPALHCTSVPCWASRPVDPQRPRRVKMVVWSEWTTAVRVLESTASVIPDKAGEPRASRLSAARLDLDRVHWLVSARPQGSPVDHDQGHRMSDRPPQATRTERKAGPRRAHIWHTEIPRSVQLWSNRDRMPPAWPTRGALLLPQAACGLHSGRASEETGHGDADHRAPAFPSSIHPDKRSFLNSWHVSECRPGLLAHPLAEMSQGCWNLSLFHHSQ